MHVHRSGAAEHFRYDSSSAAMARASAGVTVGEAVARKLKGGGARGAGARACGGVIRLAFTHDFSDYGGGGYF